MRQHSLSLLMAVGAVLLGGLIVVLAFSSCSSKAPQQDQVSGEVVASPEPAPLSDPYELPSASPYEAPLPAIEPLQIAFHKGYHNVPDKEVPALGALAGLLKDYRFQAILIGNANDYNDIQRNRALSYQRARAVYDWLLREGVPAEILTIASGGTDGRFVGVQAR
uniref:OmpA-like domain-containing protein n=1 Tax=viral metagenome TaxID=1070528 RepID=A0A6M3J4R2_9ZZZZ